MVIEKATALREAEKLLRTGQLAQAIDGYEQIVGADPDDWKTRSLLAQLHARAGEPAKAVEHLASAADILHLTGDTVTAESLYLRILTIAPGHEHALSQIEEIQASREALSSMTTIAEAVPVAMLSLAASIAPDPVKPRARVASAFAPGATADKPFAHLEHVAPVARLERSALVEPLAPVAPEPLAPHAPVAPIEPVSPAVPFWSRARMTAAAAALVVAAGAMAGWRHLVPAAAAAATGTLTVTTQPAGVDVIIDGQARGQSPFQGALSPGSHVLVLARGDERRTIPVTITAGSQVSQFVELAETTPKYGQLQVVSDPPGASVSVDGQPRGHAPLTLDGLAPGAHAVTLSSAIGSVTQQVNVAAGTTASLMVPMGTPSGAPVSGWIAITAPVDVQVFENQRLLGSSRTDRIMVAVGRHDLQLSNDAIGYRATRTVQVAPGQVANVKLEMPKGSLAINAQPWAEVWIDGEHVGETPIGSVVLAIGPHDVVFRHPEFGERKYTSTITLDSPARLSVDMRKK